MPSIIKARPIPIPSRSEEELFVLRQCRSYSPSAHSRDGQYSSAVVSTACLLVAVISDRSASLMICSYISRPSSLRQFEKGIVTVETRYRSTNTVLDS